MVSENVSRRKWQCIGMSISNIFLSVQWETFRKQQWLFISYASRQLQNVIRKLHPRKELIMQINTDGQLDRHFQGYARVTLDNIDFSSGRDLENQNVNRLVRVFELEGCKRESTANAISVLVERSALEEVHAQQCSSSADVKQRSVATLNSKPKDCYGVRGRGST